MICFRKKKEKVLQGYELNVIFILRYMNNKRYFLRSKNKEKLHEEQARILNMYNTQEIMQVIFENESWSIPRESILMLTTEIIEIFE